MSSPTPKSRRIPRRIAVSSALFAAIFLILLVAIPRHPATRTYRDPLANAAFGPTGEPFTSYHLAASDNWIETSEGLAPIPGAQALRIYRVHLDPDHELAITLDLRLPPGGTNVFYIDKPDPLGEKATVSHKWENQDFQFAPREFADLDLGAGMINIGVGASTPTAGLAAPSAVLRDFEIRFVAKSVDRHNGAQLFFIVLCVAAYAAFLFILVPLAMRGASAIQKTLSGRSGAKSPWRIAFVLAAALAVALFVRIHLREDKLFDDLAAFGNAERLLDSGFDTSALFFRSRVRPGLVAWHLPWASSLSNAITKSNFTPSDAKSRMFYFYDRVGAQYGAHAYLEESIFFAALSIASVLAIAGMGARWGPRSIWVPNADSPLYRLDADPRIGPIIAAALAAISGALLYRTYYNILSEPAELAVWLAAAYAAVEAWRRPSWSRIAGAGLAMSLALTMKESFVALASAVVVFQLWTWRSGVDVESPMADTFPEMETPEAKTPAFLTRAAHFALFWGLAATLPLIYFGLVLDTGFDELWIQRTHLAYTQQYHGTQDYPPLTWLSAWKEGWKAFGPALPIAAIGLGFSIVQKRKSKIDRFFLCWAASMLWILTLPFLLARFLIPYIPVVAWFAFRGVSLPLTFSFKRLVDRASRVK